ncbi:MAG TPA: glycoside hydrolase family 28 protein [Puia sp.]|nr:glycoside hydrolase family 28 protein [Puia sp.]
MKPILMIGLALSLAATHPADAQDAAKNISWYIEHCPFPIKAPILPTFPDKNFTITDFGAIPDGHTLNTEAFRKAITACSAAGGGRVIVPSGNWLTGPIMLLSHVNLYLAADAVVQFTGDHTQYPMTATNNGAVVTAPLFAEGVEDIAITGDGAFDGAGETWRPVKKEKTTPDQWNALLASGGVVSPDGKIWWPSRDAMNGDSFLKRLHGKSGLTADDYLPARDFLRPVLCTFINCKHILMKGVLLRNSPKFVFYPNHCSDLTMDHVRIFNEWWAQNGDGIDISASHHVLLYQCTVNAGDDGICMKSSGAQPGGAALHDVIIAGCTVGRAHGGFVIGSNTDGGMHNIFVSDCTFTGTDIGLRFKSNMGRGGLVDNIFIDNIHMQNIVHEAVLFDTYYENMEAGVERDPNRPKPEDKTPEFRDFHISHVYCNGAHTGISITGLPQMPVSNIFFDTLEIRSEKGLVATQAKAISLHEVNLVVQNQPAIQADKTAEIRVAN